MPQKGAAEGPQGGKASKWKQQSAQLRLAMQANKGGSSGEAAAAMLAETHQVSLLGFPLLQAIGQKSRQTTGGSVQVRAQPELLSMALPPMCWGPGRKTCDTSRLRFAAAHAGIPGAVPTLWKEL